MHAWQAVRPAPPELLLRDEPFLNQSSPTRTSVSSSRFLRSLPPAPGRAADLSVGKVAEVIGSGAAAGRPAGPAGYLMRPVVRRDGMTHGASVNLRAAGACV